MAASLDTLTRERCRAAREVLGWSFHRLAPEAGPDDKTVRLFEVGRARAGDRTLAAMRRAFEGAGVGFPPEGGARLRERSAEAPQVGASPSSGVPLGDRRRAMDELDAAIAEAERRCAEQRAGAARQAWPGENGRQATAMLRRAEDHLVRLRAEREMLAAGGVGRTDGRDGHLGTAPAPAIMPALMPEQCRDARRLLGWSRERLAGETGLNTATVGNFERGTRPTSSATVGLIRRALEAVGVEFLADGAVRLGGRRRA